MHIETDIGGSNYFRNTGEVIGHVLSFKGGAYNESVRNDGKMVGDVHLGGGYDKFDFGRGTLDGTVYGGAGDDHYVVRNKGAIAQENSNEGLDLVSTFVSFTLGNNVETLSALGNRDIRLVGNDGVNVVHGNSANNRLSGMGGDDHLDGGAGKDRLTGGEGVDHFIFSRGDDWEIITDFEIAGAAHDKIFLSDIGNVSSFDDILVRMEQVANDVRIDLGHGDHLLIKDVKIGDFGDWHFF